MISKEKLEYYTKKLNGEGNDKLRSVFGKGDEVVKINKRFDEVSKIIWQCGKVEIGYDKLYNQLEKIKSIEVKFGEEIKTKLENLINIKEHSCIGLASHLNYSINERWGGIENQSKNKDKENKIDLYSLISDIDDKEKSNFIKKILCIIGGFDFDSKKVADGYRILSNIQKDKDDYGGSVSSGRYAWINSHFSDNTLFFEFVKFIKDANKDYKGDINQIPSHKNIALCYPLRKEDNKGKIYPKWATEEYKNDTSNVQDIINSHYKDQQKILEYRFPFKFLWMWANKDKVVHPLSLKAFKDFVDSEFMKEIIMGLLKDNSFKELIEKAKNSNEDSKNLDIDKNYAQIITNAKFDDFTKIWKKISEKVLESLPLKEQSNDKKLKTLSKIISFLTLSEVDMKNISDLLRTHKQIVLYGVPGTGKTYSAKELIKEWIVESSEETDDESDESQSEDSKQNDNIEVESNDKKDKIDDCKFSKILQDCESNGNGKSEIDEKHKAKIKDHKIIWDIVQFHPSMTYQDFIGGIMPNIKGEQISYTLNHGLFKRFCDVARENENIKFVFIIDEINRANLSDVFGELLYALEYRDESVSIAHFGSFSIPSNVYIIGTMNNVDKSLATFDLALRRRFGFFEVKVNYDSIDDIVNKDRENKIGTIKYIERCKDLNGKITGKDSCLGLENHCQIGQAYFGKIKDFIGDSDEITPDSLEKIWIYHLEPLLQEYMGMQYDNDEMQKLREVKGFWTKDLEQ